MVLCGVWGSRVLSLLLRPCPFPPFTPFGRSSGDRQLLRSDLFGGCPRHSVSLYVSFIPLAVWNECGPSPLWPAPRSPMPMRGTVVAGTLRTPSNPPVRDVWDCGTGGQREAVEGATPRCPNGPCRTRSSTQSGHRRRHVVHRLRSVTGRREVDDDSKWGSVPPST